MILCCGEALIDMLPRETAEGAPAFAPHAGGAVFNTAIALGRLGAETAFFSGISTDFFGDMLKESLAASNVETSTVAFSDRPTTLAFVRLAQGQASYAFYDEGTAGRYLSVEDLPLTSANALFFGGISLATDPCGAAYEALMLREASRAVTMIDPNIRPGFISDEAAYRARIGRMIEAADIVKVSDEDLRWLEGNGTLPDLARSLLKKGPRLVAVTQGADGVAGYTSNHDVWVEATKVDVVDTVGAGDTFNAGLLASLDRSGLLNDDALHSLSEDQIGEALTLGSRAAAVTVSRAGANPPWAKEL
ncbi:carbohydrate kinase family protein [Aestuariibius insulae]|uniref:carbohydrate kinase family protein n=1 Tax=Aestuariibius insulae TaxID=2058287 RepID=UPI00345E841C